MFYPESDWEKMRWKVHKEITPELKQIFEPCDLSDYDATSVDVLIKYIVYVYHLKSPLVVNEPDIKRRKVMALEMLNLDPNNLTEEIQNLVANRIQSANYAKIQFLKYENNLDWLELVQYTESYYQIMTSLTDEDSGNKSAADLAKTKLQVVKEMNGIKKDIDQLSAKIFKGDIDQKNFVASYLEEEKRIALSPEDIGEEIRASRGEI